MKSIYKIVGACNLLCASLLPAQAQKIYEVSPNGNGKNSLEEVRKEIRKEGANRKEDVVVLLTDGTYYLSSPLVFDTDDGGNNTYSVTYKAKDGAKPILSGGKQLTSWTRSKQNDRIFCTPIEDISIVRNLYVNGKRAQRAQGEVKTAQGLYKKDGKTLGLLFKKSDIEPYNNASSVEINYIHCWRNYYFLVEKIIDGKTLEDVADDQYLVLIKNFNWSYTMAYKALSPGAGEGPMNRFYFENAEELLDQPGEWYFNPSSKMLYYYAHSGETPESIEAYVPSLERLIDIKSSKENQLVENLNFEGIDFCHNTWNWTSINGFSPIQSSAVICAENAQAGDVENNDQRKIKIPGAVSIEDARNIRFSSNRFLHLGSNGIDIKNNTDQIFIEKNAFSDISGCAVSAASWIHRTYNYPGEKAVKNTCIRNNYIENIGAEYASCVAIEAFYTENLNIEHNELFNLPYSGISVGWGWHISPSSQKNINIVGNSIIGVIQKCYDGGAIYSLSHFGDKGLRIENNYIDEQTFKPRSGREGAIYTDEQSSNVFIKNNVIKSDRKWFYYNMAGTVKVDTSYVLSEKKNNTGGNKGANTNIIYPEKNHSILEMPHKKATEIIQASGIMPGEESPALPNQNIALGKTVIATSSFSGYYPQSIVDGNNQTMWHSGEKNLPYIYVNLGEQYQINRIEMVTQQQGESYEETRRNFLIELSNDPSFPEKESVIVYSCQENAIPERSTLTVGLPQSGTCQYVRIRKNKNGEHLAIGELRIYGTKKDISTNIASSLSSSPIKINYRNKQLHIIKSDTKEKIQGKIKIYNTQGVLLQKIRASSLPVAIPMNQYPIGVYIVEVLTKHGLCSYKILLS